MVGAPGVARAFWPAFTASGAMPRSGKREFSELGLLA